MFLSFKGRHGGLGMFGIDIIGLKEMDPKLTLFKQYLYIEKN